MMRRLFLIMGLTLVALAVLIWFGGARFADRVLRPWAVTRAATALAGEVGLERLELGWGRLELAGLQVVRPGELRLQVQQITVRYTLAGLWQRRLESVVIRQPELEWQNTGKPRGEPTPWPQQPPLQIADWRVETGRLLLNLGKDRLLLREVEAKGNLGTGYRIEAAAVLGSEPGVALAIAGDGRWDGRPELTLTQLLWSGRALLQTPVTIAPGVKALEASVSLARLDDAEVARLLTALERPLPWPPELRWEVTAPRLSVGIDAQRIEVRLESVAGEIRHRGQRWPWESFDLRLANAANRWEIDAAAVLPAQTRVQLAGTWSNQALHGRWQLAVPSPASLGKAFGIEVPAAAEGLQEIALSGDLQVSAGTVASEQIRLTGRWRGNSELSGTLKSRWQAGTASITASDLAVHQDGNRLANAALDLSGRPAEKSWQGSWRVQIADLQRLAATVAGPMPTGLPNLQELELQGEMTSADGRLVLPARVNGRLTGAGTSGKVAGRLTVRQLAAGWRCEIAQLAATALEYTSPDGQAGVTGGALQLAGTLDWQQELAFALHGEAGAGEALAGSWYADLGGLPLHLAAEGSWRPATGRIRLQTGHLDLAGLLTARMQGTLTGTTGEMTGEVSAPRLDGAFQKRLQQLTAGAFPDIERLSMGGGVTINGNGRWRSDGWDVAATVRPKALSLAWGEAIRLAGVNGELPLALQRGTAAPATDRQATLTWDELRLGPMISAGARTRLTAGANRWRLEDPLHLAVGGGQLELAGIAVSLPAEGPAISTAVKATEIELAELSRAFGGPAMGGQLGAELPEIRLTREAISIGGEALLKVFAGEARVRNMRLDQPFSRYPTYHADLDFAGIDLQLLTRTFAFGEINGVADGFVHDLRLFGAVPSAFRASFETREKGPRNISVKAIHNLNTLSQGGLSAALSHGIYRFIDFYRYRKIGIRCQLQNDVFRLEGTAKPGTSTYLIDGGWLVPRIDVIVSSPTISFQEMVKRLKRIDRTGH